MQISKIVVGNTLEPEARELALELLKLVPIPCEVH